MNIIEKIKEESLSARKNKDALKSSLLTTLYSEIANIGKNAGNRDTTDAEAIAVIKKFLKGIDETIAYLEKTGDNVQALTTAKTEKSILDEYLPSQLSEVEIEKIITTMLEQLSDRSPKQMGVLMKQLKEKYDGQYDGAVASKIIKSLLQ